MEKTTTITVRVPVDLKRQVEALGKKEDRSLTKLVERALRLLVSGAPERA